jgi:Pentapeptide repeats (9 copies)
MGGAWFQLATFTGDAVFDEATFTAQVWFQRAALTGDAQYREAKVLHLDDRLLKEQRSWLPGWTVRPDPTDPTRGTLVRDVADAPPPHDSD